MSQNPSSSSLAITSFAEYVALIRDLPFEDGTLLCSSFMPSGLFDKDAISAFVAREAGPAHVTNMLWEYGKRFRRAMASGALTLLVEDAALQNLCRWGQVHEAAPHFEVGFATRERVLRSLLPFAGKEQVITICEEVPYVFRLQPPDGVLVDVRRNVMRQTVQGLWLTGTQVYAAFAGEGRRLASGGTTGSALVERLMIATTALAHGRPADW